MKVLIIEDDLEIIGSVSLAFKIRWPQAEFISTHLGEEGIKLVESKCPDVVILDLGLIDISGFEVLKQIRLFSSVPILILSVRMDESDIVRGLEEGADDYMVKPFKQFELLSRIRALTRRKDILVEELPLICGQLHFVPSTRQLFCSEKEIDLTPTEALILHHLMRSAGQVVTYSSLAETVWGENYSNAAASLKVYIRRLRKKLEVDPSQPQLILTKSSLGYLLVKPD